MDGINDTLVGCGAEPVGKRQRQKKKKKRERLGYLYAR